MLNILFRDSSWFYISNLGSFSIPNTSQDDKVTDTEKKRRIMLDLRFRESKIIILIILFLVSILDLQSNNFVPRTWKLNCTGYFDAHSLKLYYKTASFAVWMYILHVSSQVVFCKGQDYILSIKRGQNYIFINKNKMKEILHFL